MAERLALNRASQTRTYVPGIARGAYPGAYLGFALTARRLMLELVGKQTWPSHRAEAPEETEPLDLALSRSHQ